tara:strand:+ start:1643 stop:1858 length:216 start_codon:yes stop_codon:yes gene_type:complete
MFNPEEDQEAFDFAFEDIVKSTLRDTWMNNLNPFPQGQRIIQIPGMFIMFEQIEEMIDEEYNGGEDGEWIF